MKIFLRIERGEEFGKNNEKENNKLKIKEKQQQQKRL